MYEQEVSNLVNDCRNFVAPRSSPVLKLLEKLTQVQQQLQFRIFPQSMVGDLQELHDQCLARIQPLLEAINRANALLIQLQLQQQNGDMNILATIEALRIEGPSLCLNLDAAQAEVQQMTQSVDLYLGAVLTQQLQQTAAASAGAGAGAAAAEFAGTNGASVEDTVSLAGSSTVGAFTGTGSGSGSALARGKRSRSDSEDPTEQGDMEGTGTEPKPREEPTAKRANRPSTADSACGASSADKAVTPDGAGSAAAGSASTNGFFRSSFAPFVFGAGTGAEAGVAAGERLHHRAPVPDAFLMDMEAQRQLGGNRRGHDIFEEGDRSAKHQATTGTREAQCRIHVSGLSASEDTFETKLEEFPARGDIANNGLG
jgi:hypothetical protein